jgi:hypothetical protein
VVGRANWIHIRSEQAGPRITAILSVLESCRRLKIPICIAIHENISAQFRADMINIFNRTNLAPAGWPTTSEAGEIGSTIGPFLGNPGIGPDEPFNVQFSLKILF